MTTDTLTWQPLCSQSDLVSFSGVAALFNNQQIALFYLPNTEQKVFAISNHDPFSGANVIARGIVGDLKGELVVASPLYKQHFCLTTGICQEDPSQALQVWPVRLNGDVLEIAA